MSAVNGKPAGWLIPVISEAPMTWGAGAIALDAGSVRTVMELAKSIHPRWLMMIKWRSLLADSDETCGTSDEDLDRLLYERIMNGTGICFGEGQTFALSHCAEAFFDGRIPVRTALQLADESVSTSDTADDWIRLICEWRRNGADVFLLKGEE